MPRGANVTSGALSMVVLHNQANFDEYPSPTITRIRGQLDVHAPSDAGCIDVLFTCGILLVYDEAAVATLPDPSDDLDADWLWWASGTVISDTPCANFGHMRRFDIDSKAQRRTTDHKKLVFLFRRLTDTAGALTYYVGTRTLVKV